MGTACSQARSVPPTCKSRAENQPEEATRGTHSQGLPGMQKDPRDSLVMYSESRSIGIYQTSIRFRKSPGLEKGWRLGIITCLSAFAPKTENEVRWVRGLDLVQ